MKEIQSLNDLEIEKIYERIFEIAKTTKNEEI